MPVKSTYVIDSLAAYQNALDANPVFGSRVVYRGQAFDSPLVPKLFRIERIPASAQTLRNLERELLREFENQARPFLENKPQTILEWIAIAQHHGLPTRLLDWTQNPLVALFFAVHPPTDRDGVVWLLRSKVPESVDFQSLDEIDERAHEGVLYFPPHISPRIAAQQGCFSFHKQPEEGARFVPLDEAPSLGDSVELLRKLTIPGDKKHGLLKELAKLGVDDFAVFPDLVGLARKLEWKIYNHEEETIECSSAKGLGCDPVENANPELGTEYSANA